MAICPPHPSGTDEDSLGAMYPILNDYSGLELSTLAQNKNVAIPSQNASVQVTNGVRKVGNANIYFMCIEIPDIYFVKLLIRDH